MRSDLKFGLITGLILILWTLTMWLSGLHNGDLGRLQYISYIQMVVTMVILFFGIKQTRDIDGEGYMTFGKGVGAGTIIGLVTTIINTLFYYVYVKGLNPDFDHLLIDFQKQEMYKTLVESKATEKLIDTYMTNMPSTSLSPLILISGIIGSVLLYVVISLIFSAILKRHDDREEIYD